MQRRSFLKVLGFLPFLRHLPAVTDEEWEDFEREARPAPQPPAGILGVAMGEPLALTVLVPPDRVLKITGSVYMPDGGQVALVEDQTILALYRSGPGDVLDLGTIIRPTMGSHTYRLECKGEVYDSASHRPYLMVTDIAPTLV